MDFKIKKGVLVRYKGADEEVVIPNSVTNIGSYAFYDCKSLKKVIIPDSVTSIEERAFEDCRLLTNITIPDSVTKMANYIFGGSSPFLTIKCNPGSCAEKWAKSRGLRIKPMMSWMRLALREAAANAPTVADCDFITR